MGAADIVPGISGGTVAFITGIYPPLLTSIKSFDLEFLRLLTQGRFAAAWERVNGSFLLPLLLGIGLSIFTLAQVLVWVMHHHPLLLWSFFFGLVLSSAVVLKSQLPSWSVYQRMILLAGLMLAIHITTMPASSITATTSAIFFSGSLAICAMILPGISGSFILLLLGMYSPVLMAIKQLDLVFLLVFASGCGIGLLCFSHLLSWLLERYRDMTMALLTGFLLGSLLAVWPWKKAVSFYIDRHGELKPLQQMPVLPGEYLLATGIDPNTSLCLGMAIAGVALVFLLARYAKRRDS